MKKLIALVLAALMLLALTACGNTGSGSAATAAAAPAAPAAPAEGADAAPAREPVTLTYWYWADTPEQSELMQKIVAEYNATNTMNVTVKAEENAWNSGGFTEDMYVAVAGGGGPDVATFRFSAASMYNNGGFLYDLTDMINGWEDKDTIPAAFWEAIEASTGTPGKYYLMPWTCETLYCYYRPSLFEEAGVSVPTTYEEFMEAIEKCTLDRDGDGETDQYGIALRGPGGQEPWYYWIAANGGSFDDLTSPEAVAGMTAFKSILDNGWCPKTAVTDALPEIKANFLSGKCAMMIHHIGSSVDMVNAFGDDVAAFTFPASASGKGWDALTDGEIAVMSTVKDPAAAFDFAAFMSTGKGSEMWFEGTNKCNMNSKITATEKFQSNPFLQVTLDGMAQAGTFPFTPYCSEFVSTSWSSITQKIMLGQMSVEDGMAAYQKALFGE